MKQKLLLMALLLCAAVQGAWADDYSYPTKTKPKFHASYGGKSNVVVITTEAELAYVTENFSDDSDFDVDNDDWSELNYYLDADLDMGTDYSWLPMGRESYSVTKFEGTFWGNGHTIKFKTWDLDEENQGLFSTIHKNGKVYNVNVVCDISTKRHYVGGIAGENYGLIENCNVTASITCDDHDYVGGIAGKSCGNISGCRVSGTITGKQSAKYVGGISGWNSDGKIDNCWVSADVSSEHYNAVTSAYVGGITGINKEAVLYCCMTGNVKNPKNDRVGGVIGYNDHGTTNENPLDSYAYSAPASHLTFYGTIENNHKRDSKYMGSGRGYHLYDDEYFSNDGNVNAYLTSWAKGNVYCYAVQYPFAINVSTTGPGFMKASAERTRPGKTVTLTPAGKVESITIKDADGNNVDFSGNATDGYTFTMPKRDVNVTATLGQSSNLMATAGDDTDPYVIDSEDAWIEFVYRVNKGNDFRGKFIRLDKDITITETVGLCGDHPFSGTFLGNGHTLTANISSTATGTGMNEQGVAPFHYIKDATIEKLTVAGTIASASYHTAGLVGFAEGSNNINYCTVTATLNISSNHAGGIVGHGQSSSTNILGCVFAGTINSVDGNCANIGGIWGWSNGGIPMLMSCLEAGTYTNIASMHPIGLQRDAGSVFNCFYVTPQVGNPQHACTASGASQASTTIPSNEIYMPLTINGINLYAPCTISGKDVYSYTGSSITIDEPTVTLGLTTLVKGTDYTYTISSTVQDKGVYAVTFTGQGAYAGSKTVNIYVTDENIADNAGTLTSGKYMVNANETLDGRLTISGNVVLHIAEGATLTAQKGIELSEGNTLTIEGEGTLLINQCEENKSGIGAVNVGTLIINGGIINVTGGKYGAALGGDRENLSGGSITINGGKVTAQGGYGAAGIGGGYKVGGWTDTEKGKGLCGDIVINGGQVKAKGGETGNHRAPSIGPGGHDSINNGEPSGTLTLGWTSPEDFVEGYRYILDKATLESITFVVGKQFLLDGESTIVTATAEGITGKIVPYIHGLPGNGTTDKPYTISSTDEWNQFVSEVYGGNDYSGKVVKLTEDISVSQKVGTVTYGVQENAFCGTFLGDNHTITATITDTDNQGTALFCYVKDATIQDLTVAGTITGDKHAAALVGFADGTTTIENCKATANVSGGSHIGGLLGHGLDATLTISGCVFSGTMTGGDTAKGAILGWGNNEGTRTITDCLYLMSESQSTAGLDLARMHGGTTTATDCYKTTDRGTYGTQVSATEPEGEIYKQVTATDGNTYYMLCTVTGVQKGYQFTKNGVGISYPTVTAADGTKLVWGYNQDFNFDIYKDNSPVNKDNITEKGEYEMRVYGYDTTCSGIKKISFVVDDYAPVTSTTNQIYGKFMVYDDVTINERITVLGDAELVLAEGKTLYARKGIELGADKSLTISGEGALIIDDCDAGKSGIGAATMGTLTIKGGQLTITGAEGAAGIGSDNSASPSGTLTLGWTNPSDYIDCSSYAVSSLSFAEGKQFVVDDEQTIATTKNIGGQKIIPAVVLADTGDNTAALAANRMEKLSVALAGRTIYLDGEWNTLCLPFDFGIDSFNGIEARTLTDASIEGSTLNLTFSNPVDTLKAGVPYIFKAEKEEGYVSGPLYDLVNPVFHDVLIDNTARNYDNKVAGDARVRFIGTYKSQTFDAEDKSILLMGTENTLYYPQQGATIGAQRAYFKIGDGSAFARITAFNLSFADGDDDTQGIISAEANSSFLTLHSSFQGWHTLDGCRLQGQPTAPGIYINNGKKRLIK